jgi:hypothetical protein
MHYIHKAFVGKPEGKKWPGIRKHYQNGSRRNSVHLDHDQIWLRCFVNTAMNVYVAQKAGNSLIR